LSVISYQLSVVSYQLSVVSCQLSDPRFREDMVFSLKELV